MSYTYLHYDNVLIIELREEKHLKQNYQVIKMIKMMVIKEHLLQLLVLKYKRRRWFVGMVINCRIANWLFAICSDRLTCYD